jgi:hypothetical protein
MQLNTYGHSLTFVKLAKDLGMEGLFLSKIPAIEKDWMIRNKELEFNWEYSDK